jgi:hypothetical protein
LPIGTQFTATLLKEENHASQPRRNFFPPTPAAAKPLALKQLWEAFPEANRQRTLQALLRLVAQQIQPRPGEQEVRDEDC